MRFLHVAAAALKNALNYLISRSLMLAAYIDFKCAASNNLDLAMASGGTSHRYHVDHFVVTRNSCFHHQGAHPPYVYLQLHSMSLSSHRQGCVYAT